MEKVTNSIINRINSSNPNEEVNLNKSDKLEELIIVKKYDYDLIINENS